MLLMQPYSQSSTSFAFLSLLCFFCFADGAACDAAVYWSLLAMVLLWWRCRALLVIFTTTTEQTYFLSLSLSLTEW